MKAWEVLKHLQEGEKIGKDHWDRDMYIELNDEFDLIDERDRTLIMHETLEDSDSWFVHDTRWLPKWIKI